MLNKNNILTITKKELKTYFNNPTAYIVMIVFLILWEFLFFRNAFLVGEASLRPLFSLLPWLFLILVPAITMGSISHEKKGGTLEILLTHPITNIELISGKFIASLLLTIATLLFIFPVAISFEAYGTLDWGVVAGQYMGGVLLAAVLISLGISVSSLLDNQISALLVTAASFFFLIISGSELITASLPFSIASFLEQLSVTTHFNSISRGVIDLRDVWYFLSITTVFLSLAYLQLLKRKFGNRKTEYRNLQTSITLLVGIVILTNIIGQRIPGRIDLTQERLFTLTPATKKILRELDDTVNITVYASRQLPAQFQPILRNTQDSLRDYQTVSQGNIIVTYKDPGSSPQVIQEATSLGIREVQFNVIGQEELKLKKGYFGLAVSFGDDTETIPFIQDTADLEYQLTSFINKLTATEKKKLGFLSGHGEKNPSQDYQILSEELKKQFEIETITINDETEEIPEDVNTIIIAGPTDAIDEKTRIILEETVEKGKSLLFLVDPIVINPQGLLASENENSFADFVSQYGVTINKDLVYDLRSNETVSFGGGLINYFLPYPFWIQALVADQTSPITAKLERAVLPWVSSINLDEDKINTAGFVVKTLFSTSRYGGTQKDTFTLAPDQEFSETDLGEQIIAVSLAGKEDEANSQKVRMVIVGDSDFLTDQFLRNSPEDLAFGIQALSWLSQEESLSGIQLKQRIERKLFFENNSQITMVKYGNMGLAFLLPAGVALFRLNRRRNLKKLKYSSITP